MSTPHSPVDPVVSFSRERLHELVWTTAMHVLARRFGLTVAGLAKLCHRHAIPLPNKWYWGHHGAQKGEPRKPLPSAGSVPSTIVLDEPTIAEYAAFDPEIGRLLREETNAEPIVVPAKVRAWHPLSVQTRAQRARWSDERRAREAGEPVPVAPAVPTLDMSGSSKGNSDRAARIMDTLIHALEKRGHRLFIKTLHYEPHRPRTMVLVLGEEFQIRIYEPQVRKTMDPTPDELERRRRYPNLPWDTRSIMVDTGLLELQVYTGSGTILLRKWRDGAARRLEGVLNEVMVGLLHLVDKERYEQAERLERTASAREAERQEQLEAERRRQREEERKREDDAVRELLQQVDGWHRSRRIREYLAAFRQQAIHLYGPIQAGGELDRRLAWADSVAERLDPLRPREPSSPASRP